MDLRDAVGQAGRSRLQDVGRLDLVDAIVTHGAHVLPSRARPDSSPSAPSCRTTTRRSPPGRAARPRRDRRSDLSRAPHRPAPGKSARRRRCSTSSSTQRMPEISGSSHSSKKTRGRFGRRAASRRMRSRSVARRSASASASRLTPDEAAEHPDHLQDLGDRALVERDDREAAPYQFRREIRLQIGERQHQIRLERLNLVEPRVDERRHFRFLPRLRRPHGVARYADDAVSLSEEVQRFGRLFRQTDDSLGVTHRSVKTKPSRSTVIPVSIGTGCANIGPPYAQV